MSAAPDDAILLVGVGRMGVPIAARLAQRGFAVHAHDVNEKAMAQALAGGASRSPIQRLTGLRYSRMLLCLPEPDAVSEFVQTRALDDVGYARAIADFTTMPPSVARAMQARLGGCGVDYLDAPLSGGERGAASGDLVAMASGSRAAFDDMRPVLSAVASHVHFLGDIGMASQMKAIDQFVYLGYNACFSAGLSLADEAGIPGAVALDVLRNGAPRHPLIEDRLERVLASHGADGFAIVRCLKDMNCLEGVDPSGLAGILHGAIQQELQAAKDSGRGSDDILTIGVLPKMER